jgi:hypothetical protein
MGTKRNGDKVMYTVRNPNGKSVATFNSKRNAQMFVRMMKRSG